MSAKLTLRVTVASDEAAQQLVTAWLESQETTITVAGQVIPAELTYVKES